MCAQMGFLLLLFGVILDKSTHLLPGQRHGLLRGKVLGRFFFENFDQIVVCDHIIFCFFFISASLQTMLHERLSLFFFGVESNIFLQVTRCSASRLEPSFFVVVVVR